jgi:hypothetical protein
MRIERIAVDASGHDEDRPARRGSACDGGKKAKRFRICPMHIFDRYKKRPLVRRTLRQSGDHALLAVDARSCVHRLILLSRGFGLGHLKEVAQIECGINFQPSFSHHGIDGPFGGI